MKSWFLVPYVLAFVGLLSSSLPALHAQHHTDAAGYLPLTQGDPLSITDLVLLYQGGTHRLRWTADELMPYVVFRDSARTTEEWLFDGFLFIEFKDNKGFEYAHGYGQKPARKQEWLWLLERVFERGVAVDALDRICLSASQRIGNPIQKRKVVLTLPEPILHHKEWGELNGNAMDFDSPADRVAACRWYIEEALKRWHTLAPGNLELAGFYWVAEYGSESKEILPRIGEYIRSKGKKFFWIPYWNAGFAGEWKSLGFDAAYQQPNHFFNATIEDNRLNEACAFARSHAMGLEMEFDHRAISSPNEFRPRFFSYLEFFKKNSVIESSAMAYYEGGGALLAMSRSPDSAVQAMYRDFATLIASRQRTAAQVHNKPSEQ